MNKIMKLFGVIALSMAAQVAIASVPTPQELNKDQLVSPEALMRGLKYGFQDYYDRYSHSLEVMRDILACDDKEYNEIVNALSLAVEDLCARKVINTIIDEEGNTPLILAAKYNCPIMIKYLIEQCGVTNFDAKNIYGRTAYDYMRTPKDRIGSSELDDAENCFKVENNEIVKLKHKPIIHGDTFAAEYLKSKRLKYKFEQAVARDPRLMALRAQDAQSAAQRAKRRADKKQNNDKALQEIREKTRTAIAERTKSESMQSMGIYKETPAQQLEEATRLTPMQAQKAQEDVQKREQEAIKQEQHIIYKLQMQRVKAQRTKKLLQAWKWALSVSKRKKEVENNGNSYAFKMSAVHGDSYWHARYQGDAQALVLRDKFIETQSLDTDNVPQWWQAHDQANCAVCKRYTQAQLAAASGNPKQLQRRKSF